MSIAQKKRMSRGRRAHRTRSRFHGTAERPRLSVFRSNLHISAQVIDDVSGVTVAQADDRDLTGTKREIALAVGKRIAEVAKAKGIESIVFDRGGYLYHGRVKALADGAREGGLKF
ncbi:MAG: 50S ribosomal protein L18 [Candidatus Kerfeldbacteria bacterium CG15_BIG_FIL_POST_REV_8_21_14_020_45_12]|uniref:Large ribosomal subunit protein uL18 n=1 Tax=Candidatus Kerfeldbacteria bacterium CG15_BIG_FIL_POST_REV_8_21_14_020_45_12 TaxID=2014247 RepID=A0A2M7H3R6_9BACT|nr:MAG: 50S ribosomal protein L18 [Candidatus Kerfeldbacteria bacterium CG15_BIG_FIL_POST_REV_8_21_14_020_45_12]PJA94000.1 MAG: 50S ribosomal protein L18 [Candidatus Kerfeldbacteria bacterium CG_4_9_14_3_um_filter_45_8]